MDTFDQLGYHLDEQVGFALRRAYQRHMTICTDQLPEGLTSMQFSTLFRLATEPGPVSQNALGRLVAMDAATTKGVVARLEARGLIVTKRSPTDRRRLDLHTTEAGRELLHRVIPTMKQVTADTLAPLNAKESATLLELLRRIS